MIKRPWFDKDGNIIQDEKPSLGIVKGDLGDFVSPIDGKTYSGRKGLREHCAKHNVVPTADLKGLPYVPPAASPRREEIREAIKKQMANKGLL